MTMDALIAMINAAEAACTMPEDKPSRCAVCHRNDAVSHNAGVIKLAAKLRRDVIEIHRRQEVSPNAG